MAITLVATPADPAANSFLEVAEANSYFETRAPLDPVWVTTGDEPARYLIMATKVLSRTFMGGRRLVKRDDGKSYYVVAPKWNGTPTTTTQSLPFPRTGLQDSLQRTIDPMVIPVELKEATAELAGQLRKADRTLDNDVAIQGIKSISAGPVSLSFSDSIHPQVLPEAVLSMLPPWWYEPETIEDVGGILFEVLS